MSQRYLPKKKKSPAKAIREHCIECMGGRANNHPHKSLVRECTTYECALHDFRFGVNPFNRKTLGETQKSLRASYLRSKFPQESRQNRH